ncbi:MAG: porin [Magnetovibrionaceae bacterium]
MKKVLFGTTALVATGLIAGTASAAEPIKLSVSGYMEQWVGFSEQGDQYDTAGPGGVDKTSVGTGQDSEIHFKGSTTLDNGIKVSVKYELEGQGGTNGIDESVLTLTSPTLGTVMIGSEDNAQYIIHHTAPDVGIGHADGDVGDWVDDGGTAITDHTGIEGGGDASKIQYLTPVFGGVGLGAGYTPDTSAGDASEGGYATTSMEEQYFAAIYYDGDIAEGMTLHLDAGIAFTNVAGNNGVGANSDEIRDISIGASLATGGFTFGGGYINRNQNTAGTTSVDGYTAALGASYETGPYGISLSGLFGENEGATATAADDEFYSIMLSGSYALGPGIDFMASALYASYDDETTVAANDNDGYAFVTGFALSF